MKARFKKHSILPGFRLTLGYSAFYTLAAVLLPLAAVFWKGVEGGAFLRAAFDPRALQAYRVSFGCALLAAGLNAFFGFVTAWALARYQFPFKRILDAAIDLPLAIPTAVSGIALCAVFAPDGWPGAWFYALGIETAYTPLGIVIALTFIGLPFVVRTLQPALSELDRQFEEAALSLGASRWQCFWRVILPEMAPALLIGFALAFGRALGEYGSVIFIAGNIPYRSEIAALLIVSRLEQYDYHGAAAIACVMLLISFCGLLALNLLQRRLSRGSA
ncbi:MAG: sulfate ABC transporter permease subunit CysT [Leptospirales bacterium]|nr:sulfate ABC transporter permease subunit CysT [Leptospirales bacterium]